MQCAQDFALLTQNEKIEINLKRSLSNEDRALYATARTPSSVWQQFEQKLRLTLIIPLKVSTWLTCVYKHAMHVSNVGHLGHFFDMQTLFVY